MKTKDQDSLSEAGRKGGEATKARYGAEFYRQLGRRSGERRRALVSSSAKEAV